MYDGARAHGTGLFGDVEVTFGQPPVVDGGLGLGNRKHFGVSGGVLKLLHLVVGARDDASLAHEDGTDGDLVLGASPVGESQRFSHKIFVALEVDNAVFHEIEVLNLRNLAQGVSFFEAQMREDRRGLGERHECGKEGGLGAV